jgi:putative hydrolase of the HAD superfamily
MLKAVVFDFGNVVGFFDHFKTLERLKPYTSWTPERIYEEIYNGELEEDLESGRISVADFTRVFMQRCEIRCDADALLAACRDIFTPNPAVCDLVPRLRGKCRMVLGSNTNAVHAAQFQAQFADVLAHFHHQVLSHVIGVRKPKAEFFRECVRRAECEPGECLFVDDMAANVAGARATGMNAVLYHAEIDLVAELARHGIQIER